MQRELAKAARAQALVGRLKILLPRFPAEKNDRPVEAAAGTGFKGAMWKAAFLKGVRQLKEHIRAGDIFQAVLSGEFSARQKAAPMDIYRGLRLQGASPYLYMRDGDRHLLGPPERLGQGGRRLALNCPIAGTRPRGRTRRLDAAFERALKASPKERAEHLMLVDLARNDLGRVCVPGSVRLPAYERSDVIPTSCI